MPVLNNQNVFCRTTKNTEFLSLDPIDKIEDETFKEFENLKELSISKNEIKELNGNTFVGLTKLEKLNLSYCKIDKIEAGTFAPIINLKHLTLSGNDLSEVINSERIFHDLEKLEILELENCNITQIKRNVFRNLPNLHTLILSNNVGLVPTYKIFVGMPNLKTLKLSNCGIRHLEDQSFVKAEKRNMAQLEILDLSNNDIVLHTDEISCGYQYIFYGMDDLKHLNLSNNKIDTFCIQTFFKYLTKLETLNLSNNPIVMLIMPDKEIAENLKKSQVTINLVDCPFMDGYNNTDVSFRELYIIFELIYAKQENNRTKIRELESKLQPPSELKINQRNALYTNQNPLKPSKPLDIKPSTTGFSGRRNALNSTEKSLNDEYIEDHVQYEPQYNPEEIVYVKSGPFAWSRIAKKRKDLTPNDIIYDHRGGSESEEEYYKSKYLKYKHFTEKLLNIINQNRTI